MARPKKKPDGRSREARAAKAAEKAAASAARRGAADGKTPPGRAASYQGRTLAAESDNAWEPIPGVQPEFKLDPVPKGMQAAHTYLGRALMTGDAATVFDPASQQAVITIKPMALENLLKVAMETAISRFAEQAANAAMRARVDQ